MRACGTTPVTDTTLKDVSPLTADLTTAELAEALGALRFHGKSRCRVYFAKDVRDYLLRAVREPCRRASSHRHGLSIIRPARDDDVLPTFCRRCWSAITAQAQRMARSAGMIGMTARK